MQIAVCCCNQPLLWILLRLSCVFMWFLCIKSNQPWKIIACKLGYVSLCHIDGKCLARCWTCATAGPPCDFLQNGSWGIAVSSIIMMVTLWTVSQMLHNLREMLKYCWRAADSLWKPYGQSWKVSEEQIHPSVLQGREVDVICSGEQNQVLVLSMASLVTSLLALKIAPLMFCVADGNGELAPPCCQIPGQFSFRS